MPEELEEIIDKMSYLLDKIEDEVSELDNGQYAEGYVQSLKVHFDRLCKKLEGEEA
jgi:hypothetical protein